MNLKRIIGAITIVLFVIILVIILLDIFFWKYLFVSKIIVQPAETRFDNSCQLDSECGLRDPSFYCCDCSAGWPEDDIRSNSPAINLKNRDRAGILWFKENCRQFGENFYDCLCPADYVAYFPAFSYYEAKCIKNGCVKVRRSFMARLFRRYYFGNRDLQKEKMEEHILLDAGN